MYNAVARSHVCAAMDGYNSVIFAYGQTASGKTFTLVCAKPQLNNVTRLDVLPSRRVTKISPELYPAL